MANIGFIANGKLFDFDASAAIIYKDGNLITTGKIDLGEKSPAALIESGISVPQNIKNSTLIPTKNGGEAFFAVSKESTLLMFKLDGMNLCVKLGGKWCIFAVIKTENLRGENSLESRLKDFLGIIGIKEFTFLIKSKTADTGGFAVLENYADIKAPLFNLPDGAKNFDIMASGIFNLDDTIFGKAVKSIAKVDTLTFFAGGSISNKSLSAALSLDRAETNLFLIENFAFQIALGSAFSLSAGGTFTLKLEKPIKFHVSGNVTMSSFMLSASSAAGTKLSFTSKLFFSDLILGIGFDVNGLMLTMCGRLTTPKISVFAGFSLSISEVPSINLLTAAVTTATGRLSLYDLITDIAEINLSGLEFLDIIAIKDLDMNSAQMSGTVSENVPENVLLTNFNNAVTNDLKIQDGNLALTPMGKSYIVTDRGKMRHYRVSADGKISLNCQIFICTKSMQLGNYKVNPGFFICGVLEIFGEDVRFLFQVVKGESLIALVGLPEIRIGSVLKLRKSQKKPPINPINGGLAGELVKPDSNGGVFYINVSKSALELYVSAELRLLDFLIFDALAIIREKMVYIEIELNIAGIKLMVQVAADYSGFSSGKFAMKITFDTSSFREKVLRASNALKNTAKSVEDSTRRAINDLENAKRKVNSLNNDISYKRRQIEDCKNRISSAKWYKKAFVAIAEGVKILAFEVAIGALYVAMGVAQAALTLAQGIVGLGGAVAAGVLKAAAFVLEASVNLFMIKNFTFLLNVDKDGFTIGAALELIVLGKEKKYEKILNKGNHSIESLSNSFLDTNISDAQKEGEKDIKDGKVSRNAAMKEIDFPEECMDLKKAMAKYEKGKEMLTLSDNFLLETESAYREIYGIENSENRSAAADLTIIENEIQKLHTDIFEPLNDEFYENLDYIEKNVEISRSPKMSESFSVFSDIRKDIPTGDEIKRNKSSVSLFDRMEKMPSSKPKRSADNEILTEKQANKEMALKMEEILKNNFGRKEMKNDNDYINLHKEPAVTEAINLLKLSGRRTKARRTKAPEGYVTRLPDEE